MAQVREDKGREQGGVWEDAALAAVAAEVAVSQPAPVATACVRTAGSESLTNWAPRAMRSNAPSAEQQ
jgi:hypothetical protein